MLRAAEFEGPPSLSTPVIQLCSSARCGPDIGYVLKLKPNGCNKGGMRDRPVAGSGAHGSAGPLVRSVNIDIDAADTSGDFGSIDDPIRRAGQMHLAGHTTEDGRNKSHRKQDPGLDCVSAAAV